MSGTSRPSCPGFSPNRVVRRGRGCYLAILPVTYGMRRALWIRIVTAMWGVWLGVALTQPMMLHPCAAHGGPAAQMTGMPGMSSDGSAAQNSAMHHDAPAHGSSTTCTCLSDCCCAPPASVPVTAQSGAAVSRTVEYASVAPTCDESSPAAAVAYAHPFANGPPVAI